MGGLPDEHVRAALDELLSWPAVARSPQLARFLAYIVDAALKGEEANIKAYSIAVDVFGRPASFDPQSDPIVRVQARRLRALLDQFYDENRAQAGVRIHLPVGRYVPEFVPLEPLKKVVSAGNGPVEAAAPETSAVDAATVTGPAVSQRSGPGFLTQALLGAGIVLAIAAAWTLLRPSAPPTQATVMLPAEPLVMIGEFVNVSGIASLDPYGVALARALERELGRFEDIEVSLDRPGLVGSQGADAYILSGALNPSADGFEVTVQLTGQGGATLWSSVLPSALPGIGGVDARALAHSIAREIAPYRGPLHEAGRMWLDDAPRPLPAVGGYVCLLTYRLARETGNSNDIADSFACQERLLKAEPNAPLALSSLAWLEMRALVNRGLPNSGLPEALKAPLAKVERALEINPRSSLLHEHAGSIKNWQMEFDASARELVTALEINPLNTDARAAYSISLSRAGNWVLAGEQASLAIADTPYPASWYFYPLALNAFRDGRLADAIASGQRAAAFSGGEVGSIIALAAAALANEQETITELLPRVMGMENLRRAGIIVWLGGQIADPGILARLGEGLALAGVPAEALTAPF